MRARWMAAVACGTAMASFACGGGSSSNPATGGGGIPGGGGTSSLGRSHNAGRDCLACHREFSVAGTVYAADAVTTLSGASVRLTTAPEGAGSVVQALATDGSGSFRTSQSVGFGSGLYVDVAGPSGTRIAMKSAVTSGACNSCHDASRRITAN